MYRKLFPIIICVYVFTLIGCIKEPCRSVKIKEEDLIIIGEPNTEFHFIKLDSNMVIVKDSIMNAIFVK